MTISLNPAPKPRTHRIMIPSKISGSNLKGRNLTGKTNRSHTRIKGKSHRTQMKRSPDRPKKENQAIIALSTSAKMILHLLPWNFGNPVGKD